MYANDGSHTRMQKRWWGGGNSKDKVYLHTLWVYCPGFSYSGGVSRGVTWRTMTEDDNFFYLSYALPPIGVFKLLSGTFEAGLYKKGGTSSSYFSPQAIYPSEFHFGVKPAIYEITLSAYATDKAPSSQTDINFSGHGEAFFAIQKDAIPDGAVKCELLPDGEPIYTYSTLQTRKPVYYGTAEELYMVDTLQDTTWLLQSEFNRITVDTQNYEDFRPPYALNYDYRERQVSRFVPKRGSYNWAATGLGMADYGVKRVTTTDGHVSEIVYTIPFSPDCTTSPRSLSIDTSGTSDLSPNYSGQYAVTTIGGFYCGNFNIDYYGGGAVARGSESWGIPQISPPLTGNYVTAKVPKDNFTPTQSGPYSPGNVYYGMTPYLMIRAEAYRYKTDPALEVI